jgi:hypothetical protein
LIAAGTMPFYTGRYSIDFLGKTDPYIASLPADTSGAISRGSLTSWPGHNKYDLDYSINHLQPTYVSVFRWGNDIFNEIKENEYTSVIYQNIKLDYKNLSPYVLWEKVEIDG